MSETDPEDALRRLLHRWFVQYNPLYLVSAAMVLAGLTFLQIRGGRAVSFWDVATPALLAEVYAAALIGSAALLTRLGQRRPAILLALIALVYQADPTFVTEVGRSDHLEALWLALFVAKLFALGKALRVRLSGRALWTAGLGGALHATMPWLAARFGRATEMIAAISVLGLGALLPTALEETVTSEAPLDDFGRRVLGRAVTFAWGLWTAVLLARMEITLVQRDSVVLLALAAVALARAVRASKERHLWTVAAATVLVGATLEHEVWTAYAALASIALAVRSYVSVRHESIAPQIEHRREVPYRTAPRTPPDPVTSVSWHPVAIAERARLLTGALLGAHLAVGPAAHGATLWISLTLLAALAFTARHRLGSLVPLATLLPLSLHALVASRLAARVTSFHAWGAVLSLTGFALLLVSVWVSSRARGESAPRAPT